MWYGESWNARNIGNARVRRKGVHALAGPPVPSRDDEYDRLAEAVRSNLNWGLIERIVGLG